MTINLLCRTLCNLIESSMVICGKAETVSGHKIDAVDSGSVDHNYRMLEGM